MAFFKKPQNSNEKYDQDDGFGEIIAHSFSLLSVRDFGSLAAYPIMSSVLNIYLVEKVVNCSKGYFFQVLLNGRFSPDDAFGLFLVI